MAAQSPGRSVLIAVLIAIPVVGMSGILTVAASSMATPAETAQLELGRNQAELRMVAPPKSSLRQESIGFSNYGSNDDGTRAPVDPATFLLAGTRILSVVQTPIVARTATGIGFFPALEGQPWDPAFTGKYTVVSGRAPRADDEVMVTPAALARLGTTVGGTAIITKPVSRTVRVVGTLSSAAIDNATVEFFGRPGSFSAPGTPPDIRDTQYFLPDTPVSWSQTLALNKHGAIVVSRTTLFHPPAGLLGDGTGQSSLLVTLASFLIGGFVLFEVALLAGAAFAVGARHQQRALAILTSVGADRRMLFRIITFNGVILGAAGAVTGSLVGVAAAWAYISLAPNGNATQFPGFHLNWIALVGVVVFATCAAWIAAAVPARSAARVDVVGALRGATRPPKPSRRRPLGGLIVVFAGAGITAAAAGVLVAASAHGADRVLTSIGVTLLVIGPILMQLGATLIAPLILRWCARLFASFGSGARLGSRDASRNPSRSVPALAAIMSTVFVTVFIINLFSGSAAQDVSYWTYTAPVNAATVGLRLDTLANGINQPEKPSVFSDASGVARALDTAFDVKSAAVLSSVYSYPSTKGETVPTPRFTSTKLQGLDGCAGPGCGDTIWIGSERAISAVIGHPLTAVSKSVLERGGVVSLYSSLVDAGTVTLDWKDPLKGDLPDHGQYKVSKSVVIPAALQKPDHSTPFEIMMLPSTAQRVGLSYQPSLVIAPLGGAPTEAQTDRANAALDVLSVGALSLHVETGPTNQNALTEWALLALSALIALASATIAIALARADGRRDSAVLGSLGAPPTTRRAFGFWQAIILAGVGSVIGVALGLVPSVALSIPDAQGHALDVFAPAWPELAATLLGIPILIAAGAWLTAGRGRSKYNLRAPID
ncbi:MAG TPA: FtsX-like permease family protein [Galbitalea sp.]|jgi:hypothetical protein